MERSSWISVRAIAALDLAVHREVIIVAEYGVAALGCAALGVWGLAQPKGSPPTFAIGLVLVNIGLNYAVLLAHAVDLVRQESARQEAALELAHLETDAGRYLLQTIVLLVCPLVLLVLAVRQEAQRQSR